MKYYQTILLLLFLPFAAFSQQALRREINAPREGDRLVKQSVPYRPAGASGENIVWDFRSDTLADVDYPVAYFSRANESGMIGAEPGRLLHYRLSGDSLLMTGCESPDVLIRYRNPALFIKFPVAYGDSLQDDFSGRGKHSDRLESINRGRVHTSADGFGTIVLPDSTRIANIVRLHTHQTETSRYAPIASSFDISAPTSNEEWADTVRFSPPTTVLTDIYRWYEPDYRYPVFETVESCRVSGDSLIPLQKSSFVYHPFDQIADTGEDRRSTDSLPVTEEEVTDPWKDLVCLLMPNPAQTKVNVEMYLPLGAEIRMQVHTIQGFTYIRKDFGFYPEGEHSISLDVSSLPTDNYVLDVRLNDYLVNRVLMKR